MKFRVCFFCICMFSTMTLFSQEKKPQNTQGQDSNASSEEPSSIKIVNADLQKNSRGLSYGLVLGGAIAASFGTVLELSTLLTYFVLDENTRIETSTDSHVFSFLHITSATFITAGITSIISGTTYIDDSIYSKNYWKKTQVITGSVLTSVGSAATIAGLVLYAAVDMKDTGAPVMGSGVSLMSSGLVSLFIGLFAQ